MPRTEEGVGWKGRETSRAAAAAMSPKAGSIREKVLAHLRAAPAPLTSEEISDQLGIPYGSVQPRLSELAGQNLVRDSGVRKLGRWGKWIIAWEAIPTTEGPSA